MMNLIVMFIRPWWELRIKAPNLAVQNKSSRYREQNHAAFPEIYKTNIIIKILNKMLKFRCVICITGPECTVE